MSAVQINAVHAALLQNRLKLFRLFNGYVQAVRSFSEAVLILCSVGMLRINLTDDLTIRGSLYDDWHIGPVR